LNYKSVYAFCKVLLCTLVFLESTYAQLPQNNVRGARKKVNINQSWKFSLGSQAETVNSVRFDDSAWEEVHLPHSFKLVSLALNNSEDDHYQKTFQRDIGWYRKTLKIAKEVGEKVFLEFEGAHQITSLWVNGQFVGEHKVGAYTPFHFEITNYLSHSGEDNLIVLKLDNTLNPNIPPEGDQYDYVKFSGLYRDVYLVTTNELYIPFPWENRESGVFVSTPSVTAENATIQVRTTIRNASEKLQHCQLLTRVLDHQGVVVAKVSSDVDIASGNERTLTQTTGITENLRLWSTGDPYLYRVHTSVMQQGQLVDVIENPLGIRKLEYIDGVGILLNGKNIELIGANRHQAYPFIGDAVPNSLHWKDAWQLKQAGFNVVRLAHYPHDNSFLEACDELGLLVYEEPPTWIGIGSQEWMDRLEEATRRMIRNHRNHPSVFTWGAAINHRGPVEQLHYAAKEEDPTRPTSSNGSPWTGPRGSGICDLYAPMDYQDMPITDRELSFLCEHGSSVDAIRNQVEVSRSRASPNRIGVAVWTAHDYQTFKPKKLFSGRRVFSIYRVPNPVYYWYQSELLPEPMVYIADERATNTSKKVSVFSNCQRVELYNNGKLVSSQLPDKDPERLHVNHPSFSFTLQEERGDLEAIGFINHKKVAFYELAKAVKATRIKVEIEDDDQALYANSSDMKMVRAYLLDERGNLVRSDERMISFSVLGDATIIGDAALGANPNRTHQGVASALLRVGSNAGDIVVQANAKGLEGGQDTINSLPFEKNVLLTQSKAVYDNKFVKIDLGNTDQLVQFGWHAWSSEGEEQATQVLKEWPGAKAKLNSSRGKLSWTSSWGMSGNNAYLLMDGVKVEKEAQLSMSLEGLPPGNYQCKVYLHHREEQKEAASIKISLDNEVILEGIKTSSGFALDQNSPAYSKFMIKSDGKNDIKLEFADSTASHSFMLNGFELKEMKHIKY